ncbi:hypothetical protein FPSE_01509 [Fusarium pseudograminearum CS3096]|uniref:Uncharacterized protein n=1 Tax=Fusarium pseudograminearum (strain CS3096) TaxID=1028729 RepID=K3VVC5_FUSPC|nr:hypothetical protein FPSE_01509 [Fusarium pseudograminearum CS3096]EKJ78323.1 hypothetical protein FPSE_01509 [Fusarium pseudograminearum CS3096]
MSGIPPPNMAGSARATPQQMAATLQHPTTSMDQLGNFPTYNGHSVSWGNQQQQQQQNNQDAVYASYNAPRFANQQQHYAHSQQNGMAMSHASQAQQMMANSSSASQNGMAMSGAHQPQQAMSNSSFAPQNVNGMSGTSQGQQMMANSSSAPQNANTASTPLVVSSQMFRLPTQRPSATPAMANSGAVNGSLNQNSMGSAQHFTGNAQPFMGNNQGQYAQASYGHVQNHMAMNNMHMAQNGFGGMQTSFMGNGQASSMGNAQSFHPMANVHPNFMGNPQAQFNNGFMPGSAPNPMMNHDQSQAQFMANMQALRMGAGQGAAHNMPGNFQSMPSVSMSNVQSYGHMNAQDAQGFQPQTPSSGLNAAAASFAPTQGDVASQQQSSVQTAVPFSSQTGLHETPQMAQMAQMGMQGNAQTQHATPQAKQKATTKRSPAAQPNSTTPKRRNKPVNDTFMQKANNKMRSCTPAMCDPAMGKLVRRVSDIATGDTLPQDIEVVSMACRKQPEHPVVGYLTNPEDYPITPPQTSPAEQAATPQDSLTEQLIQQHPITPPQSSPAEQLTQQSAQQPLQLPVPSRAPSVGELSSLFVSEEHTSPSTQAQLNAVDSHVAASVIEESVRQSIEVDKPLKLTKREKELRRAEAAGEIVPPSARRIVRLERDDPRLQHDADGSPIQPPPTPYTVFYVPPIGELSPDVISRQTIEFIMSHMTDKASGNKPKAKVKTKDKPKPKPKSKSKATTKAVNQKNADGKLTTYPSDTITVKKRRNATTAATTADASQAGATDTATLTGAAPLDNNNNINEHVGFPESSLDDFPLSDHAFSNNNGVVAQPNTVFTAPRPNTVFTAPQPNTVFTAPQPDAVFVAPEPSTFVTAPQPNTAFAAPASAPSFPESQHQTAAEVGDVSESSTVNDLNLAQFSTAQDAPTDYGYGPQFTSEPTPEPTNTAMPVVDTLVDPALAEPTTVQQNQQMRNVSDGLSQGATEQSSTDGPSLEDQILAQTLTAFLESGESEPNDAALFTAPESSTASQVSVVTEPSVESHPNVCETSESDLVNENSSDKPTDSPSDLEAAPSDTAVILPETESSLDDHISVCESPDSDLFSLFNEIPSDEPSDIPSALADGPSAPTDVPSVLTDDIFDDAFFFPDGEPAEEFSYMAFLDEPLPGLFNTDPTDPVTGAHKRKAGEDGGAEPNKKARTIAPATLLALPQ